MSSLDPTADTKYVYDDDKTGAQNRAAQRKIWRADRRETHRSDRAARRKYHETTTYKDRRAERKERRDVRRETRRASRKEDKAVAKERNDNREKWYDETTLRQRIDIRHDRWETNIAMRKDRREARQDGRQARRARWSDNADARKAYYRETDIRDRLDDRHDVFAENKEDRQEARQQKREYRRSTTIRERKQDMDAWKKIYMSDEQLRVDRIMTGLGYASDVIDALSIGLAFTGPLGAAVGFILEMISLMFMIIAITGAIVNANQPGRPQAVEPVLITDGDTGIDDERVILVQPYKVGYDVGRIIGELAFAAVRNKKMTYDEVFAKFPETSYLSDDFIFFDKLTSKLEKDKKIHYQFLRVYNGKSIRQQDVITAADGTFSIKDEMGYTITYTGNVGKYETMNGYWTGPFSPNNKTPVNLLDTYALMHDQLYLERGLFDKLADDIFIHRVNSNIRRMGPVERIRARAVTAYYSTISNKLALIKGAYESDGTDLFVRVIGTDVFDHAQVDQGLLDGIMAVYPQVPEYMNKIKVISIRNM